MGRMNLEIYKQIKKGLDDLGVEGILHYDEYLAKVKEINNFSDEDMEDYDAIDRCEVENEIEEGHLTGYDCPICKNRGYMNSFYRQNGKIYFCAVDCGCKQIRRMFTQLEQSGIHRNQIEKYRFDTFTTFENWEKLMKGKAQYYVDCHKKNRKFDKWFVMSGRSGSGKSHLCTSIFVELAKMNKKCKYMLWKDDGDNLMRLKKSYDVEAYNKAINPYKVVEVLYIDDFLKLLPENALDRSTTLDVAYSIINARYANGLTTIISTELSFDEMCGIDEATFGRIKEKCDDEYNSKIYSHYVLIGNDQRYNKRLK